MMRGTRPERAAAAGLAVKTAVASAAATLGSTALPVLLDELTIGCHRVIEYSLEGAASETCSHRLELREAILLGYHEVIGRRGLEETHDA